MGEVSRETAMNGKKDLIRQVIQDTKQLITSLSQDYRKLTFSIRFPAERRIIRSISQEIYESNIIEETEQKLSTSVRIIPEEYLKEIRKEIYIFIQDIQSLTLECSDMFGYGAVDYSRVKIQRMFHKDAYEEIQEKLCKFKEKITTLFRERITNAKDKLVNLAHKTVYGESSAKPTSENENKRKDKIFEEFRIKIEDFCSEKRAQEIFKYSFSLLNGPPVQAEEVLVEELQNDEELLKSFFEVEIGIIKNILKTTEKFREVLRKSRVKNKIELKTRKEIFKNFSELITNITRGMNNENSSFIRSRLGETREILEKITYQIEQLGNERKEDSHPARSLKKQKLNTRYKNLEICLDELVSSIKSNYGELLTDEYEEELAEENKEASEIKDPLEFHLENIISLGQEYLNWLKAKRLHEKTGNSLELLIENELNILSKQYPEWLETQNKTPHLEIVVIDTIDSEQLEQIYQELQQRSVTEFKPVSIQQLLEKVKPIFEASKYYQPSKSRRYGKNDRPYQTNPEIQQTIKTAELKPKVSNDTLKMERYIGTQKIETLQKIWQTLLKEYQNHKDCIEVTSKTGEEDKKLSYEEAIQMNPIKDYLF